MASKISICNGALAELGETLITSFDENTKRADLCKNLFDDARDEILRAQEWNCAIHRETLTSLSDAPAFGYDYQYTLPTNPYCLKALDINENPRYEYKIEGRRLLTNYDEVNLRYTMRVEDTSLLDPLCARAIALNLAAKLCYPLHQSRKMKVELLEDLRDVLAIAGAADWSEDSQETEKDEDYDFLVNRL